MATTTRPGRAEDNTARAASAEGRRTEAPHDDIARRAYELYERRGGEPGHDIEDWLEAEREVRQARSAL